MHPQLVGWVSQRLEESLGQPCAVAGTNVEGLRVNSQAPRLLSLDGINTKPKAKRVITPLPVFWLTLRIHRGSQDGVLEGGINYATASQE